MPSPDLVIDLESSTDIIPSGCTINHCESREAFFILSAFHSPDTPLTPPPSSGINPNEVSFCIL